MLAFALGHFSFSGELGIVMNENCIFCPHYQSFTSGFDHFTRSDSNQIDLSLHPIEDCFQLQLAVSAQGRAGGDEAAVEPGPPLSPELPPSGHHPPRDQDQGRIAPQCPKSRLTHSWQQSIRQTRSGQRFSHKVKVDLVQNLSPR